MAKRHDVVDNQTKPLSKTLKQSKNSVDDFNRLYESSDLSSVTKANANKLGIKDVPSLVNALRENKDGTLDIEARAFFYNKKDGNAYLQKLDKKGFLEAYGKNKNRKSFKEAIDCFQRDFVGSPLVGQDSIPLLGGPFNKQLYLHDYLQMHTQSYYAYNHDPVANSAVNIIRDFVIGRGFRVDCKCIDESQQEYATALWRSFEEVNDLHRRMDDFCKELSVYGEQFVWWLPNNETKISYQVRPGQEPPKGLIPRIRLIDPSVIWDYATMPEDIERVLFYQWIAPTQYQMFTGNLDGQPVPVLKYIYQQIPAEEVDHFKINSVSNEKRGRSDLFPVLGYLKRLRDSVNYSIIGLQKATAWAIDTVVDGNQTDIDNYIQSQQEIGTIAPAGSEFVHSKKIERKYLSNESAGRGGNSNAFDWALSMVATGLGIPLSYFATHLSHQQTRASAVVSAQPVDKKFEGRRIVLEKALQKMAARLFKQFGIEADIEVTFPELISQDRSAKLKDLALAEAQGWISKRRSAEIAAKEFDITTYEYEEELEEIKKEQSDGMYDIPVPLSPLTAPGLQNPSQGAATGGAPQDKSPGFSGDGTDSVAVRKQNAT